MKNSRNSNNSNKTIRVLSKSGNYYTVKIPDVDIPIKMDRSFLESLQNKYSVNYDN